MTVLDLLKSIETCSIKYPYLNKFPNKFALQWLWHHNTDNSDIVKKAEICKLPWLSSSTSGVSKALSKSWSVYVWQSLCLSQTIVVPIGSACDWPRLCVWSCKANADDNVFCLFHPTRYETGDCICLGVERMNGQGNKGVTSMGAVNHSSWQWHGHENELLIRVKGVVFVLPQFMYVNISGTLYWIRLAGRSVAERKNQFTNWLTRWLANYPISNFTALFNPLKTKGNRCYIRSQCVPRCKHSPLRL
jgi:hypothetical protein